MNVKVVRLPPEDWAAYRALRLEALQTEPQAFHSTFSDNAAKPSSYWRERLEAAAKGENAMLLFARDGNGKLTGMVGALIEVNGAADVVSVYVTSSARRQGTARALMTTLLSELKSRGVKKARLQVNSVQEAALGLYRQCGFHVVEKLEFCPGDGRRDADYVMEIELN